MVPCTLLNGAMPINYYLKSEVSVMLRCQLCSTHYTAVQIKNCSNSISVFKSNHHEKYGQFFRYERKPIICYCQLILFTISKDELDTKEDVVNSMKNTCEKAPLRRLTVKKSNPSLSHNRVTLHQSDSRSISW